LLFLRERLRPYLHQHMRVAAACGLPVMRPLFVDFYQDAVCEGVEDQYMFGPDLLVAPVLEQGARLRRLYLPAGTDWEDAWTGARQAGGQWIEIAAPIETIPVFLRAGSDLGQIFREE
jgi:alpha-D-xyloside xylohydrolase